MIGKNAHNYLTRLYVVLLLTAYSIDKLKWKQKIFVKEEYIFHPPPFLLHHQVSLLPADDQAVVCRTQIVLSATRPNYDEKMSL